MRISRIEVNDFRGFPGPGTCEFDLGNAQNLLLYGENGSGKSSLFRGLQEFFRTTPKARPFSDFKNVFTDPGLATGHITLFFDGVPMSWSIGNARPNTPQVAATALRIGCIDYRALLQTNFLHPESVNIFGIAVEHLLTEFPVPTTGGKNTTIGKLWQNVVNSKPRNHRGHNVSRAETAASEFDVPFKSIVPTLMAKMEEF